MGDRMKILYRIMSLLVIMITRGMDTKSCKITDIFLHKNGYSHQFVLHSNCPLEHEQPSSISKEHGNNEVRFFIPISVKDESVLKNIKTINESNDSSYYSIKLNVKDKGVECVINLNSDNLYNGATAFELQKMKSITGKHGLLIKVHDNNALNKMVANSSNKRIKRLAYFDKLPKTIAVDCGHGGKDTGYYDKITGLQEKNINKMIGHKVIDLLKKKVTMSV